MIRGGTTIHTADGSSVTIRARGIEYDLETRNARGETISTVVMNADDVSALLAEMEDETGSDSYDEGYSAGYRDGQEAA
ncbi:hypothetical protein NPS70_16420 [Streptomyces sp. C10-9-1]|uniref:hypothetical protein n=1 Tax=Streptomyces sp. C10-9-1 TaxID=1859285 RepID=UPI002112FB74|nr:hypothetical protein [Streptomyces sp. C10-9-1]MCQ6554771.1 hypothetical protein [Streptomyces sp. C10-9-1]